MLDITMTYLQLVQALWRECRKHGVAPTSVVNQTGEAGDFCHWIARAWVTIQTMRKDWLFMRKSASWVTADGQAEYTPVQCGIEQHRFGRWLPHTFRVYLTSAGNVGEIPLSYLDDYDCWRDTYLMSGNRNVRTQPHVFAIVPQNKAVALGPIPAAGYTITGDYIKAPVLLSETDEKPDLPAEQDPMIIVYQALVSYARAEAAPDVYADAKQELKLRVQRLMTDQLPPMRMAGVLGR